MAFQPSRPFTPWTPVHESSVPSLNSPPSGTPSDSGPLTPHTPFQGNGWSERYRNWSSGGGGLMGFTPMRLGDEPQRPDERRPLGGLNTNITRSLGLASPFVPADPNEVWGPPRATRPPAGREPSVEKLLAEAEKKIRDLTLENEQLKGKKTPHESLNCYVSPSVSTHASNFLETSSHPSFNFLSGLGLTIEDDDVLTRRSYSRVGDTRADRDYIPPPHVVAAVLHGTFKFADMPHEYIRPIVWVVAHCQSRNNLESAGLKTAVNSLAGRLGLPRESDHVNVLINSIIEWARDLCYTSCGNYLCQQLLERGDTQDKQKFIDVIKEELVPIASDKFGTHVLCKAVAVRELEDAISEALLQYGTFDSLKTGARRLWREYLEKCRQNRELDIFEKINAEMDGRWSELACINEHGSIAVQQVFEVFGTPELMEQCFREVLADVSKVANNQYGHFVVTKLIGYPNMHRATCDAILAAYPPVATTHHGVNFAKIALTEGGRAGVIKYLEAICSQEDGRTPGIVAIATSSIGKAHLTFVLSCLTPAEHVRVRQVCRSYSTTLRTSQSGNDLLRALGLIYAVGSKHRSGM